MSNIDDLDFGDSLPAYQRPVVEIDEKEKAARKKALRSRINAKRSMRTGNVPDMSSAENLSAVLDDPKMSGIVNKLLKGDNLEQVSKLLGTNTTKNAKVVNDFLTK